MGDKLHYDRLQTARLELRSISEALRNTLAKINAAEASLALQHGYNPKTKMGKNDPPIKHDLRRLSEHVGLALNESNIAIMRASKVMLQFADKPPSNGTLTLEGFDVDNKSNFEDHPDLTFKQALLVLQTTLEPTHYQGMERCPICNKMFSMTQYSAFSSEWSLAMQHAITDHDVKVPAPFYKAVMDNFLKEFKHR